MPVTGNFLSPRLESARYFAENKLMDDSSELSTEIKVHGKNQIEKMSGYTYDFNSVEDDIDKDFWGSLNQKAKSKDEDSSHNLQLEYSGESSMMDSMEY